MCSPRVLDLYQVIDSGHLTRHAFLNRILWAPQHFDEFISLFAVQQRAVFIAPKLNPLFDD
jgi:hypothetical protein